MRVKYWKATPRPGDWELFAKKVIFPVDRQECWQWIGAGSRAKYGVFMMWNGDLGKRVSWRAHRAAYALLIGPIPDGLVLDHLCRNTLCVNPAHLEGVTHRENILRGVGLSAQNAQVTHCPKGHEYTPENTYQARGKYGVCRMCKECGNLNMRARRARQAA